MVLLQCSLKYYTDHELSQQKPKHAIELTVRNVEEITSLKHNGRYQKSDIYYSFTELIIAGLTTW